MKTEIKLEEALERASSRLREKMLHSVSLLRRAEKIALSYDHDDGFYLAFSGGKDSQALIHIAQLAGVRFKAHYSPTSIDPPAVIRFIRKEYPEVCFEKLQCSIFAKAVEKGILPSQNIRWCCDEFKEHAGAGKVTLIGIRKAESARRNKRNEVEMSSHKFSGDLDGLDEYRRKKLQKSKGTPSVANTDAIENETITGCISGKDSLLISPIIYWTEKDVWEFLNDVVRVPHCVLYDQGWKRLGCICCPMSSHKQKVRELKLYPHIKEKWLQAIMAIRKGGGCTNYLDRTYPFSECPSQVSDAEDKEREIAEYIFDWWISGLGYDKWYARKFLQLKLDL